MKSIGQKIRQLTGLLGTKDINEWEHEFIRKLDGGTLGGMDTTYLSPKQVEKIDEIWSRHFA
jgi:hypothetical protein